MTPKTRRVRFFLIMTNGTQMPVGDLSWPYRVLSASIVGGIVEVVDTRGVATFSLEDIHLSDLEMCR